ncbi:MAG: HD domain-containing phosphohydrolase [Desulfurivibrio sp.]|nr:HD domain-containing phosphohydrolase [Desulfurivibrio sp.]
MSAQKTDEAHFLRDHLAKLASIGIALSAEQNLPLLLEKIVDEARHFAAADAGTLYLTDDSGHNLEFAIVQNDTMDIRMGGGAEPISWPPVPLYLDNVPNLSNVSSAVAIRGEIVNIPDVYQAAGYDFSGTQKFDAGTGYRSRSMLVIPMVNKDREVIGVLQLINATDPDSGESVAFPASDVDLIASLASQAAVAITNVRLYQDLANLFDAFIKTIATAIDEKSPYTGGHIRRVQELTMELAAAMNAQQSGPFAEFQLDDDQMRELSLAGWLHDIGKIITPEYVVDKANKLETIFDRIKLIEARYEILKRDQRIRELEAALQQANESGISTAATTGPVTDDRRDKPTAEAVDSAQLEEEKQFIKRCNQPGEFMDDDKIERLQQLAGRCWDNNGDWEPLLNADEIANLSIRKGSLTAAERQIIENHALVTHKMLKQLPFPKKLGRVPEYAAAHHEKLDGSGYPFQLKGEDLPYPARIIAVADIFEALTARDRPYKKPMPLSQAIKILEFMKKDGHIDGDILDLLIAGGVYKEYARRELDPEQIDC